MQTIARIAAMVGSVIIAASQAAADPAETLSAFGKDATWLYIQTADALTFDGKKVTLTGVDPSMVIFTDRPHRAADTVPVAAFIEAWTKGSDKSFAADPPNAGVTALVEGKFRTATVELSAPKLDGTTLSYDVRVLEGTVPETAGATSVFIDGGCSPFDPRC